MWTPRCEVDEAAVNVLVAEERAACKALGNPLRLASGRL